MVCRWARRRGLGGLETVKEREKEEKRKKVRKIIKDKIVREKKKGISS